jgi:hypothetical protein
MKKCHNIYVGLASDVSAWLPDGAAESQKLIVGSKAARRREMADFIRKL